MSEDLKTQKDLREKFKTRYCQCSYYLNALDDERAEAIKWVKQKLIPRRDFYKKEPQL